MKPKLSPKRKVPKHLKKKKKRANPYFSNTFYKENYFYEPSIKNKHIDTRKLKNRRSKSEKNLSSIKRAKKSYLNYKSRIGYMVNKSTEPIVGPGHYNLRKEIFDKTKPKNFYGSSMFIKKIKKPKLKKNFLFGGSEKQGKEKKFKKKIIWKKFKPGNDYRQFKISLGRFGYLPTKLNVEKLKARDEFLESSKGYFKKNRKRRKELLLRTGSSGAFSREGSSSFRKKKLSGYKMSERLSRGIGDDFSLKMGTFASSRNFKNLSLGRSRKASIGKLEMKNIIPIQNFFKKNRDIGKFVKKKMFTVKGKDDEATFQDYLKSNFNTTAGNSIMKARAFASGR